ncbi:MAG: class I SAM-dependent DNA methyltransferase [Chloroflexi bacterium]|nr:class I SAM-dependent DNA methyltransferase [Chloroflexota bacterium]
MTPHQFAIKWRASTHKEISAYVSHFEDLCRLIDHATPTDLDSTGGFFSYQKANLKESGQQGFADVWYKDRFGWEYVGKGGNLHEKYQQLLQYRDNLANPPLLVVCDFDTIEIHTNFNGTISRIYHISLDHLSDSTLQVAGTELTGIQVIRACFYDPESLKPGQSTEELTKEAADRFGEIAESLRIWNNDDEQIAKYLTRLIFCMFASDVGLLPKGIITNMINASLAMPVGTQAFAERLRMLFGAMQKGGLFGNDQIEFFDGGLFSDDEALHVDSDNLGALRRADELNWADIEPSVFGTLFERIVNPAKRSQLGAHYTSRSDIEEIVEPTLIWPLANEWQIIEKEVANLLVQSDGVDAPTPPDQSEATNRITEFLHKLGATKILDPACGSGNFLYVSLAKLKELEQKVVSSAAKWGIFGLEPKVHPRQLFGIEIDPYAHQLASIVVWIGYLQWKYQNGISFSDEIPILQPLDNIVLMNGILDISDPENPVEPDWPEAEFIVGNPPFLGGKKLRQGLGDGYVDSLFRVWKGRVRREADLCCYWHEKARAMIEEGRAQRAGLLATQAIRGGANRATLDRVKSTGDIFFAIPDRPWVLEGAAVHVSMVGFDNGAEQNRVLDGQPVGNILSDLSSGVDVTHVSRLKENLGVAFMGDTKGGAFDISEAVAHELMRIPNPHNRSNTEVLCRWVNGSDITGRPRGMWIVDFGTNMSLEQAAMFEGPFKYIDAHVKPRRLRLDDDGQFVVKRETYRESWWLHMEPRPTMRDALSPLKRFIVTPCLSKHRLFSWLEVGTLPDHALIVFARDDDYTFGLLHSKAHEIWALKMGTQLESRPRYTPTTTFETFPFPQPSELQITAISKASEQLNAHRESWLNPPKDDILEIDLAARTLTSLYNERPTWLHLAHQKLDEAVFSAYGWSDKITDEEILGRLLKLNESRDPV